MFSESETNQNEKLHDFRTSQNLQPIWMPVASLIQMVRHLQCSLEPSATLKSLQVTNEQRYTNHSFIRVHSGTDLSKMWSSITIITVQVLFTYKSGTYRTHKT